ncbi:hypothetical protein [Comamonas aquatica]|uniref:Uncharacterized protein n=1 Tax=Comamonas aquatica TaxID=225991 RepID=A0AA42L0T3_9BURK|nr:hypothetical protein [Comamonas aquatica]MDH0364667.1 hypothetical protein [Comamonas aquatica]
MNEKNKAAQAAAQAELSLIDAIDNTQCALLKAQALIAMTFGESGEAFRNMNDDYQDRFLWAISDLVTEATNVVTEVAALGGLQA